MTLTLFDISPGPPHNGTETSILAAKSVKGKAEIDRERIMDYLRTQPASRGRLSDDLGIPLASVCARVWELMGNQGRPRLIGEDLLKRESWGKHGSSRVLYVL